MITLENDGSGNSLVFRFPEVHEDAVLEITFQRTLRLPDDGKDYPLPPGLGSFPLRHLDDYAEKLPESWRRRGGVMMPMYHSEALWIHFESGRGWGRRYPFAVKVAAGKINAVTGEPWRPGLHRAPQDYLVVPKQPWLDGFCVQKGVIRQFVAMRLGEGLTAEEQLTETAEWGGLQLLVHPLRGALWRPERFREGVAYCARPAADRVDMGLALGGRMRQRIYTDERHLEDWDQRRGGRCFVTIVDAAQWAKVTGEAPPHRPPTAADYSKAGLPWFEWYDADAKALEGSSLLAGLKSVAAVAAEKGLEPDPADTQKVEPTRIEKLGPGRRAVRETELWS